jgi:hypothetical protein
MNGQNFSDFVYLTAHVVWLLCLAVPVAFSLLLALAIVFGEGLTETLRAMIRKFRS